MIYDKIIVSRQKQKRMLQFIGSKNLENGVSSEKKLIAGIIVELHSKRKDGVEVTVFTEENQILFFATRSVIYTEVDGLETDQILSQYEVLWAAGAKIDEVSLQPIFDESGQTSLPGVYYIPGSQLGKKAG